MDSEHIDAMLAEGIAFDTIEGRIEQLDLDPDAKSLLWLYLWVESDTEDRRRIVREMLIGVIA
jgi:hypothetical protein